MKDELNLAGKVVLITGGSRGIGAATALKFARAGANVAITFRSNRKSAVGVVSLSEAYGAKAASFKCEIGDYSQCEQCVENVMQIFGSIDILVNSAGIWEYGDIMKMKPSVWSRTIDVNLHGTFYMTKLAAQIMKQQKSGIIINVSSTAGQRGEPYHSHYAASKGAIIAFTKSIAIELISHGIRVNCVAPGWVSTDMTSRVFNNRSERKKILKSIPRGVIPTPDEIAGPILFLASSLSNNIVGEVINVNGGSVLCG